jgi:hypothetical protein
MDAIGQLAARPWRELEAPQEVRDVPTMLAPQEQALLYSLARDYASGAGAIVDAGCFLGGSSAALLAGLRDRAERWTGWPVVSYDLFLVEDYTLDSFFADRDDVTVGDSFRRLYDENVACYGVPHEVHEGDIVAEGWAGGAIEVLFLDVLKSWGINDAVHRAFFPSLIPGRSVLVHQDYAYGMVPWLHITVELMRPSLRLVDEVPYASQVFLVEKPIDPAVLDGVTQLDETEKIALIDQAVAANDGDTREMVRLSKASLLQDLGRTDDARDLAERIHRGTESFAVRGCAERTLESFGLAPPPER